MKKILISLIFVLIAASSAFAVVREGYIAFANMSNEEYSDFMYSAFNDDDSEFWWADYKIDRPEYAPYLDTVSEYHDFTSFSAMLMALDAGKIDRMELEQPVAEYLLRLKGNDEKYIPYLITKGVTYYLSMGFKENNKWFEPFNETIKAMAEDDTLLFLRAKYITASDENIKTVKFEKFPDAETVKIAVTGDQPPIDYIAEDGTPAGFNTAMLAEIARRLKINVELVNINAGARAAALASGRADGVFWFWHENTTSAQGYDTPAGVVLTEPYYGTDTLITIGKKLHNK